MLPTVRMPRKAAPARCSLPAVRSPAILRVPFRNASAPLRSCTSARPEPVLLYRSSRGKRAASLLSSLVQSLMNGWIDVFNLPDLALWATAIRWRIHDDGIVSDCRGGSPAPQISTQSSTSQRIGASPSPEDAAFSFAQPTMPLEASTWVTCAPAAAAASVAPPV